MPSVEMRRSTRVFGARVLRSGRRLFPTQDVPKHMRRTALAATEDDWIELLDRSGRVGDDGFKENGWRDEGVKLGELKEVGSITRVESDDGEFVTGSRRWGLVYSRKRKRSESGDLDTKFGKKFFRKQCRKKVVTEELQPEVLTPDVVTTTTERSLFAKSKSKKRKAGRVAVAKPTRLNSPNVPSRNSVNIHRGARKRRSSLRLRKRRNPLSFGNLNSGGGGAVQDGDPFFPIKSNTEISKSIRRASFKEVKELTQDIDSASCHASILVIESDRCRREKGAVITMEMSGTDWYLVVKRNGVERFRVEARNVMRPCFCNRVTHAIIWASGDESWKLEFNNRQDWFIFKELYRECSERTVQVQDSLETIIPVPQVNEVSGYADEKYIPFKMPDSYISSRGDEVSRILEKSDPVYDMDSDDDEWLNKYNDGRPSWVDEDTFEKIIDAFERGMYCSPEDYSDVTKAVDLCLKLASKNVLEAVYGYWIARRKKMRSALVQAFEFYKLKKPEQPNFKAVLRKKRSFRQRGAQSGRGKQINFLKAALYEKTKTSAAEAENVAAKVQETKEAANRAEQEAITKRQRAQLLMELADLLTYKASIAIIIAEARAAPGFGENNTIDQLLLPVDSAGFT